MGTTRNGPRKRILLVAAVSLSAMAAGVAAQGGGTSDGGASEPVEAIAETFEEVPAVPGGSQTLPASPEGEPARPAPPPSATTSGLAGFVLLESAIVARLARTGREQRAATIDRVSMMFSYAAFAGTFVALVATA